MVYCGKPSGSCESCRRTKTKCDKKRPSCGQCIRLRRVCPGYRDPNDTLFRCENEKISRLVITRNKKSHSPSTSVESADPKADIKMEVKLPLTTIYITPNVRDRAMMVFFQQYGGRDKESFSYIYPFLEKTSFSNETLLSAIECVGTAYLSNTHSDPELMVQASSRYTSVLKAVHLQLIATSTCQEIDEMIATILLLILFETVTGSSHTALLSWGTHISGAIAIAKRRDIMNMNCIHSRSIFRHLRDYVMIYSLQRRTEISPSIIALAHDAHTPGTPHEDAQYALFQQITHVCSLRSLERQRDTDPLTLLNYAFSIDASLEAWATTLPSDLCFGLQIDTTGTSLDGYYHTYTTPSTARLWSFHRSARICTNAIILRTLTSHPHLSTLLAGSSLRSLSLIKQLSADVCASVPYFLLADEEVVAGVNGRNFVWPLYVVATQSSVSVKIRCWVIGQLRAISGKSGILQGVGVADVLSRIWEIRDWETGVDGGCLTGE